MSTPEIQVELREGALRLTWDNWGVRKDRFTFWFMVVFWIFWTPVTLFATYLFFNGGPRVFLSIWLVFGWLGTLLIPYSLLGMFRSEWLIVSSEAISFGSNGVLAPKPKNFSLSDIKEVTIGYCDDSSDRDTMVSLNIYETVKTRRARRHMVAYWLAPELKEEAFRAICNFVASQNIPLKLRRYG